MAVSFHRVSVAAINARQIRYGSFRAFRHLPGPGACGPVSMKTSDFPSRLQLPESMRPAATGATRVSVEATMMGQLFLAVSEDCAQQDTTDQKNEPTALIAGVFPRHNVGYPVKIPDLIRGQKLANL